MLEKVVKRLENINSIGGTREQIIESLTRSGVKAAELE